MGTIDSTTDLTSTGIDRRRLLRLGVVGSAALGLGLSGVRDAPSAQAAGSGSALSAGAQLNPGERITSANGQYFLIQQADGNVVLYTASGVALWHANTVGNPGSIFANQTDGNLVVYATGGRPVWSSATNGRGAGQLVVQDDGNLVLYVGGVAIWASQTARGSASSPRAEAAIAWFSQRQGSASYEGRCETAVENAFGTTGRYASAAANWNARRAVGAARYPFSAAPRGALVFYNTSSNGHVAISLGDGRVVSTSVNRRIGTAAIGYFQNPLGWADSPW